jgi:hypothetical protein
MGLIFQAHFLKLIQIKTYEKTAEGTQTINITSTQMAKYKQSTQMEVTENLQQDTSTTMH